MERLRVGLFGMIGTAPGPEEIADQATPGRDRADQSQGEANVAELAGVTSMAMGRPCASTMARVFVLRPPRARPIACASAPFSARCRTVRFGARAVDGLTIVGIGVSERFKQPSPNPSHRLAAEPIVDRRRRTVDKRAILPPQSGLQNTNDFR
jgi:hypothetical protein